MSLILCIEAGTDIGSVALAKNGRLLSLRENLEGKHHAQNLAVYVEEILRENDLDADELDAVAVGKGPGSYTGLRIAVSLAKGICYATGKPLIAVNSLEALVQVALEDFEAGILDLESLEDAKLLPMIDARRMEVYCQLFDAQARPLSEVEAHVLTAESFAAERAQGRLVLFGNGAAKSKMLFTEPGSALCRCDALGSRSGKAGDRGFENQEVRRCCLFRAVLFGKILSQLLRRKNFFDYICAVNIDPWCNGNTADSGSAFLGSSPGGSTK